MGDESRARTKFGRYALLDKIGSGGMAEIYRAKTFGAAGFEKEYAIKLIDPSLVDDTEFIEMFINEAKIVVNLYHANIVQVFDLGEIDGQYYIAMEYVHGNDLLEILARCAELNVKIPLNLVLFITMEMLKGLNFAHSAKDPYGEDLNIIHRDVSPSNIMISYAGDVKVGDFGVAKAAVQRSLSQSDTLKGKVGYMSPEQVMGEEIDPRSDIFSAGIVFYEALSMSRLFVGNSDLDIMLKVRDAEIDDAIDRMRAVPSDLEAIARKALAKDPDDRFQDASDFYQALVDFCYQHDIKVTGNDLSNMMNRLFAEEIEDEKSKRRIETNASRESSAADDARASSSAPVLDDAPSKPSGDVPTEIDDVANSGSDGVDTTEAEVTDDASADSGGSTAGQLYEFRAADGEVYGPFDREGLVELVQNRILHPEARVRTEEGPWRPVDDFDHLTELVPDFSDVSEDTHRSVPVGARMFKQSSSVEPIEADDEEGIGAIASTEVEEVDAGDGRGRTPEKPESDESSSLEDSVRAVEEISLQFSDDGSSVPDDEDHDFESDTSEEDDARPDDSIEAIRRTPDNVEAIDEMKDQYASYEGTLGKTPFPRVLGRLHLSNETGRLEVSNDSADKSIFLYQGKPILVDSSKKEELLGSFLMSRGIIDQEQLDRALDRLHEWGGRLGDALVAIGAVPAHDIYDLLAEQMREKLLDVFSWRSGHWGYYEGQEPDTKGYPLGIDTLELVVEGCRNQMPLDHLVDWYDDRTDASIVRCEPAHFELDRLNLTSREQELLEDFASPSTLETLLDQIDSTDRSWLYRTIFALHQLELIRFEDTGSHPLPDLS